MKYPVLFMALIVSTFWLPLIFSFSSRLPTRPVVATSTTWPITTTSFSWPLACSATLLPANEFSRPFATDRIWKSSRNDPRQDPYHKQWRFPVEIEANSDECSALAERFELKQLTTLSANLVLQPPTWAAHSSTDRRRYAIHVEGSIQAQLTQTCVRTNEDFEIGVEFPVSWIVQPTTNDALLQAEEETPRNRNVKRQDRYNLNDLVEVQRQIENNWETDFGNMDGLEDENVIEDEAVYSYRTGVLDVGELVAQFVWLSLDRYPKLPGSPSEPIEYTISG